MSHRRKNRRHEPERSAFCACCGLTGGLTLTRVVERSTARELTITLCPGCRSRPEDRAAWRRRYRLAERS